MDEEDEGCIPLRLVSDLLRRKGFNILFLSTLGLGGARHAVLGVLPISVCMYWSDKGDKFVQHLGTVNNVCVGG